MHHVDLPNYSTSTPTESMAVKRILTVKRMFPYKFDISVCAYQPASTVSFFDFLLKLHAIIVSIAAN